MGKFVSPVVYVKEVHISTWIVYKNAQRKKKIAKILGIDYSPNVIINSTPKGSTNFLKTWYENHVV